MADQVDHFDIKQAAAFLNVSETSLRRWTNEGRLACLRVGRRRERRFRRADLLAFMEDSRAHVGERDRSVVKGNAAPGVQIGGRSAEMGTHMCAFYGTEQGRARLAADFLGDGLDEGSVCVMMAAEAVRESILGQLIKERGSVAKEIADGRLVTIDYAKSISEQYEMLQTTLRAATREGARAMRLVGDIMGFARDIGVEGLLEYEAGFDHYVSRRFPIVTLCQYDVRSLSGNDLFEVMKVHQDTFGFVPTTWLG